MFMHFLTRGDKVSVTEWSGDKVSVASKVFTSRISSVVFIAIAHCSVKLTPVNKTTVSDNSLL